MANNPRATIQPCPPARPARPAPLTVAGASSSFGQRRRRSSSAAMATKIASAQIPGCDDSAMAQFWATPSTSPPRKAPVRPVSPPKSAAPIPVTR